jgi:hypothetical protein
VGHTLLRPYFARSICAAAGHDVICSPSIHRGGSRADAGRASPCLCSEEVQLEDGDVLEADAEAGGDGWTGLYLDKETNMPSFSCRQKSQMSPAPAPAAVGTPGQ